MKVVIELEMSGGEFCLMLPPIMIGFGLARKTTGVSLSCKCGESFVSEVDEKNPQRSGIESGEKAFEFIKNHSECEEK